jgi:hypothetical protein
MNMEATTLKLQTLNYSNVKIYLVASLFIIGNLLLPQLCHLVPDGGKILLPIYFFTLVGAYKYGWKAGLLIAVFSPIINSVLFGMPAVASLPVILIKSGLLAVAAGWTAHKFGKFSILLLTGVVLAYQTAGSMAEWALDGSFYKGMQDFRLAIPGMLLQVIGGYFALKALSKV